MKGARSALEHTASRVENTPLVTRLQSQAELVSNSGGNQLLQGTQVSAGGGYAFNAGVGEKARADARVILEGVKSTVQISRTAKSDAVVWQSMSGSGSTTETLALPSFAGGGTFSAPGGLSVQIPEGNFKSQIQTLSQQPGMGYLNDLAARKDVNWQAVKLANDQWNYSQSGLTPAGAALLSVAVAWATGGMGANLIGGTVTTTTATGATITTTTTAGLMANAAFTSLAAQASITLVNNKGDIGKTLKDMGTSSTVKATLAAMLTAGVIDKLGATSGMSELTKSGQFADKLTYNLINATGRALTNTAINGGNLEDALKQALIGGLVDTAHGQAASQIKMLESEYLAHKLAHALAGCVAGAAAGGACKDGAIGGAVGEIVAEMFKGQKPGVSANSAEINAYNAKVIAYSKLVSGAVAAYSGGNAQTAITTAETAVRNNFLKQAERLALTNAQKACLADADSAACGTVVALQVKDQLSDKLLANATATCKGSECNEVTNFIQSQMSALSCTAPFSCPDYNTLSNYLRVAQAKAQALEPVHPEVWLLDAKAALDLGKFGVKVLSGATGYKVSLDAIGQLAKTDATTVANNFYRNGANGGGKVAGEAAPGPVNLMGNGDQFFKNAAKRADIDPNGSFDVIAHGSAQNIEVMTAKGPVTVDQRVAGRLIESSPGYSTGQPVRLLSCDTGACDAGFAQNLANKMGVPVQAPTELVWAYGNGNMVVAPRTSMNPSSPLFNVPDLSRQGTFRTFKPGAKP